MKLLITGLTQDASEEAVTEGMTKFGPVTHAEIIPQGKGDVWAIVEMAITPEEAFRITQRVNDIWHEGKYVSVRILNH